MGAGRGLLGFYANKCFQQQLVAIDISSQKKKKLTDKRVKMDIQHLKLSEVEQCKGKKSCVLSKHLCGAATDFTLRAIQKDVKKDMEMDLD
eukprot:UN03969